MKQFILIMVLATLSGIAYTQTKTTKKINPGQTQSSSTSTMNPNEIRNMTTGLPDLKFTSLSVTATPSPSEGSDYYTLTITYTVKNDGKAAALADNINIQGYTTDEYWLAKQPFNPALTGVFNAACGHVLSNISGKGESISPGESIQRSYTCSSRHLPINPKPVYIITINQNNTVNESDYSNNRTQMTIPL